MEDLSNGYEAHVAFSLLLVRMTVRLYPPTAARSGAGFTARGNAAATAPPDVR